VHLSDWQRQGDGFVPRRRRSLQARAIVTEQPVHLQKLHDPESGLALIRPEADTKHGF
jgi:hypothetical protein